jgi:hypothetical protein
MGLVLASEFRPVPVTIRFIDEIWPDRCQESDDDVACRQAGLDLDVAMNMSLRT